jgi:hypothetical protein
MGRGRVSGPVTRARGAGAFEFNQWISKATPPASIDCPHISERSNRMNRPPAKARRRIGTAMTERINPNRGARLPAWLPRYEAIWLPVASCQLPVSSFQFPVSTVSRGSHGSVSGPVSAGTGHSESDGSRLGSHGIEEFCDSIKSNVDASHI